MKQKKLNNLFNLKNKKVIIISSIIVVGIVAIVVLFSSPSRVYICGDDVQCGGSFKISPNKKRKPVTGHVIQKTESSYSSAKISWEADYKENELNGTAKAYDAFGEIWIEENYKKGKYHGVQKKYYVQKNHPKNQLAYEATYKNGELQGKVTQWHKNGQLSSEVYYKNDEEYGEAKWYDEEGNIITECRFEKGRNGACKKYYPNGKIYAEYNLTHGKTDGILKIHERDGQVNECSCREGRHISGKCSRYASCRDFSHTND